MLGLHPTILVEYLQGFRCQQSTLSSGAQVASRESLRVSLSGFDLDGSKTTLKWRLVRPEVLIHKVGFARVWGACLPAAARPLRLFLLSFSLFWGLEVPQGGWRATRDVKMSWLWLRPCAGWLPSLIIRLPMIILLLCSMESAFINIFIVYHLL